VKSHQHHVAGQCSLNRGLGGKGSRTSPMTIMSRSLRTI
jgi:hypothetical protein